MAAPTAGAENPGSDIAKLYLARQARLKSVMRAADCPAVLIVDPVNIFYATGARNMQLFGMRTPARYLLLFADGPTILYEYFGCEHLARALPTIDEIRPAEGLCHISSGGDVGAASKRVADEIHAVVWSVSPGLDKLAIDRFPFALVDALRHRGFHLSDADPVFSTARSIKMAIELPYMREAVSRVELAVEGLVERIEPGRTESETWAEFHRGLIASEGQYLSTRLFQSGERTFPYFQECGARVLQSGDLVCLDTDALGYEGYAVDFSRTFLCGDGKPTAEQRHLYSLAREQLEENAQILKPGIAFEEMAELAWQVPEEHQDSRYYCIGHGLGMSGEFPNIPHRRNDGPYPLDGHVMPGMVICLESYIGSKKTGQGVKLENQFLVLEDGAESMSTFQFDQRFE
ncbi:M24 family metallopeptidase [Pacificispira sp.]|uniref:M24 family metallopeptidase n=1 Tax=Pacificispira sp. TaxID=2888761 RepID=UPI003B515C85